jgi:hypothetical protein
MVCSKRCSANVRAALVYFPNHLANMKTWSRRNFIYSGLAGAAVGSIMVERNSRATKGSICLVPIDGVAYSESFLRFMKRARFHNVRDAMASIRDGSLTVGIAHVKYAINPSTAQETLAFKPDRCLDLQSGKLAQNESETRATGV